MEESLKKLKIRFNDVRQERARKTLEDILQAADEIIDEGDESALDARNLSRKSGYALGSLVNRLGAIENVFLYAIAKARTKHLKEIAHKLKSLGENATCREFSETIANESIVRIKKINPAIIRFYEKRALARAGSPADVYCYTDEIIDPLLECIETNKSRSFKHIDRTEAKYICRAMFLFVDRPFIEGDQIAGTEEHKRFIVENLSRLLGSTRD